MTPSSNGSLQVVVADARRLLAEALAGLIDLRPEFTVGVASLDARDVQLICDRDPDIVVVGVGADPDRALTFVRNLRQEAPHPEIVIVADALEPDLVNFVLEQKIGGLLLTDMPARDIGACLDQVTHGLAVLPSGWQSALDTDQSDPLTALSERQMQVLRLLADGLSYEEIGTQLFISLNTVKFHVRSIFLRLGVRNRMAAARLLVEHH